MEQRAFNLTQPTVTTAPAETAPEPKPKRKINRKSPKRRKILKYVRENPLADVYEVAAACGCSYKYVYNVVPRRKLKRKIGHEQLKKAAKRPSLKEVKPVTMNTKDEEWAAVMQLVEEEQMRGEPAFNVAEASTMQVGGDHYRQMEVQPWDALKAWLTPEEYRGYQKGTAISYLARERSKGGDTDIRKAVHHLIKLAEDIASAEER